MSAKENILPIDSASRVVAGSDRRIGTILAEQGRLSAADVEHILDLQRAKGLLFGEAALRLGLVSADDLNGAIARQYELPHLLVGNDTISHDLVVAREPFHPRAEELRALRTRLLILWSNLGVERRVLAIISPGSGEGRSYVAANLAVAFSQVGERTLLIDADLRAPRQHRIFNVPDRAGLAAALSGRADHSAVMPLPEFGTLSLLPAGPRLPYPQELLSRVTLAVLLRELRADFDVILIDTPPAKLYADAQVVAFRAGSAMVLSRRDYTRLGDTRSVIRDLGDMGTRVVGTVLNVF
jgi:protein-tyrosine kinase